ncbi:MAG: hypothetical protein LBH81_02815 [Rickettsiales bacterium]|jgi:hypothetical protein|nr:hypothetical protein [Rickettsiales bacterium]
MNHLENHKTETERLWPVLMLFAVAITLLASMCEKKEASDHKENAKKTEAAQDTDTMPQRADSAAIPLMLQKHYSHDCK